MESRCTHTQTHPHTHTLSSVCGCGIRLGYTVSFSVSSYYYNRLHINLSMHTELYTSIYLHICIANEIGKIELLQFIQWSLSLFKECQKSRGRGDYLLAVSDKAWYFAHSNTTYNVKSPISLWSTYQSQLVLISLKTCAHKNQVRAQDMSTHNSSGERKTILARGHLCSASTGLWWAQARSLRVNISHCLFDPASASVQAEHKQMLHEDAFPLTDAQVFDMTGFWD